MKNKASLVLMELLVMVLVFALAAAACLRCFVWAFQTSQEIGQRDRAVVLAQNTAEALKARNGDIPAAQALLEVPEELTLQIIKLSPEIPGLGEAEILIENDRGELLFSLCAAWQEDS